MCHPDVNRVLNTENMLSMNIVSTTGEGGKHQCDPGGGELVGGVLLGGTLMVVFCLVVVFWLVVFCSLALPLA